MVLSIFKCISCNHEYDIKEILYRCECGNLLEVLHDLKLSIPDPEKWKNLLDDESPDYEDLENEFRGSYNDLLKTVGDEMPDFNEIMEELKEDWKLQDEESAKH